MPFFSVMDGLRTTFNDEFTSPSAPSDEAMARRNRISQFLAAKIEQSNGQTQQALDLFKKAEEEMPGSVAPRLAAIEAAMRGGDMAAAQSSAQALVKEKPESFEARMALANVYLAALEKNQNDADARRKAVAQLEAARRIEPNNLEALQPLGEIYWSDFRRSRNEEDEKRIGRNLIDVQKHVLEVSRGRERLLPLLYLAFTCQITGKLEESESYFKQAIAAEPRNVGTYLQLSALYESQKKRDKSLDTLRQALVIDPQAENVQERINAYFKGQGPDALIRFYQKLAQDFPASAEMQKLYGFQLVYNQKDDRALDVFRNVVKLDGGDWQSRAMLAHLLIQKNNKDEATKNIREMESIAGADSETLSKTATLYLESGDIASAERIYTQAFKNSSAEDRMKHLTVLLAFHLHEKHPDKALQAIDAALPMLDADQQYDVKLQRARILQDMKKTDEAEDALKELIAASPDKPQGYLQLGLLYDTTRRKDRSEEMYRQLLKKMPQKPEGYLSLGILYEQTNKLELAEQSYRKALELDKNNVQANLALGMLYDKTNRVADAERVYRRAIELDASNADAYNNLGYLYAQRGIKLADARKLIEKALELNPGAPHIIDSLGWVLFKQGNTAEAIRNLETAAAQAGFEETDSEVYEHLAQAYEKAGRMTEALAVYRKALRANPKNEKVAMKVVQLEKSVKASTSE